MFSCRTRTMRQGTQSNVIICIFYFLTRFGSSQLDDHVRNTFRMHLSTFSGLFPLRKTENSSGKVYCLESSFNIYVVAFCFADIFWGAGSPIQEKLILFLKISQVSWSGGSSWCFPIDFTIYEGSEKSYSMLISFQTCTAVHFDGSLVICEFIKRNVGLIKQKHCFTFMFFFCLVFIFSNIDSVPVEL